MCVVNVNMRWDHSYNEIFQQIFSCENFMKISGFTVYEIEDKELED